MQHFTNTLVELPTTPGLYSCLISVTDSAGIFIQVIRDLVFDGKEFQLPEGLSPVGVRVAGWMPVEPMGDMGNSVCGE